MTRRIALVLAAVLIVAGCPIALAAAPTVPGASARTWGDHPLDDVLAAADAYKRCGLSRNKLAALMMAPSWPETGAPNNLAPSPMTLSRWDAQDRLWAFSGRQYPGAFWHPGVGLWQFDEAGLGAPYSADNRIDTRVIANAMAQVIAERWCDGSPAHNLDETWQPWHGCNSGACHQAFLDIYNPTTGQLRNLNRAAAVGSLGGMVSRTCQGPGNTGRFTCWRVDPQQAQGYNGFAQPAYSSATPITAPFYVYQAGGQEYRHWLASDTGYNTGIWATRPIGQNSRTSIVWRGGTTLCDLDAGTGACCPALTDKYSCLATRVTGTYTPVSGDFNGDGIHDVLWYGPGSAPDRLWFGTIYGAFSNSTVTVGGNYTPATGDYDGDGRTDILWSATGTAQDYVWYGNRNRSFVGQRVNAPTAAIPIAGDFDGDRRFDVFWYDAAGSEVVWYGGARRFTGVPIAADVGGGFEPFAGDFDGDRKWDVFWYLPGEGQDVIWYGATRGGFAGQPISINGDYIPVAGKFNQGRRFDILWYRPGEDADVLYLARAGRTFEAKSVDIDGTYVPFRGDFTGDGPHDVFFYGPGSAPDAITRGG